MTASVDVRAGAMSRPDYCLQPGEGAYLLQPISADAVAPVLLLGSGARGVVLGGQADGGICQMVPYARILASRGFHVATFEWGVSNTAAMAAATTALVNAGATRVVVGGFSRGAVIGLGGGPSFGPQVVGVLSVSGGPSRRDGYPTVESVSAFPGPLLLICAVNDSVFPTGTTEAIAAAHPGPEDVLVLPGYDHALTLLAGTHGIQVDDTITGFLSRVLP